MPPPPPHTGYVPIVLSGTLSFPPGGGLELWFGPFRPIVWLEQIQTVTDAGSPLPFGLYPMWMFRLPPWTDGLNDFQFIDRPRIDGATPQLPDNINIRVLRQWAPRRNIWLRLTPFNPDSAAHVATFLPLIYTPHRHDRDG